MKINEVQQPSMEAIFESLRVDTNAPFSEESLEAISESVSRTTFKEYNSVEALMEELEQRCK